MARYAAITPATPGHHWTKGPLIPAVTTDGPKSEPTGLVDVHGREIRRLPPPIGFGRDAEW